ncbi:hypothetical protein WMY93_006137 [Mugilogobius chulae]|uniref:Uncharacterized protein n=1 Tax=Mugilogobius chulae TaxID=88201 RepID=A0AAW0PLL7_9GOBI
MGVYISEYQAIKIEGPLGQSRPPSVPRLPFGSSVGRYQQYRGLVFTRVLLSENNTRRIVVLFRRSRHGTREPDLRGVSSFLPNTLRRTAKPGTLASPMRALTVIGQPNAQRVGDGLLLCKYGRRPRDMPAPRSRERREGGYEVVAPMRKIDVQAASASQSREDLRPMDGRSVASSSSFWHEVQGCPPLGTRERVLFMPLHILPGIEFDGAPAVIGRTRVPARRDGEATATGPKRGRPPQNHLTVGQVL